MVVIMSNSSFGRSGLHHSHMMKSGPTIRRHHPQHDAIKHHAVDGVYRYVHALGA